MQRTPRSVDAIVEQQVQKWLQERQRNHAQRPRPAPVIAVSRQYGALGAELAKLAAEKMGFSFWDQEILHQIAKHAHVSERMVAAFDEHHRLSLVETVRSMMQGGPLSSSEYFRELARVIHSIAAHGAAVLVGRGVQFMLRSESVLRVRVVCPLDRRVQGLARRRGISEAAARAEIETVDADRHAFIMDHYGRDVEDPLAYDLVINTGAVPIEGGASMIAVAYEARFPDVRATARA